MRLALMTTLNARPIGPLVVLGLVVVGGVGYLWLRGRSEVPPRDGGTAATASFVGDGAPARTTPGLLGAYQNAKAEIADKHAQLVCPHCQTRGTVTARRAKRRRRLSVTRVAGAAVTLGASLPVAGTSKKNVVTEMHCSHCNTTWDVA